MASTSGPCLLCGEINSTGLAHCKHCGYRLPWADEVEGVVTPRAKLPDTKLDAELKALGLLNPNTVRCRFCNELIEVDAKQCPHCKEWLAAGVGTGFGSYATLDATRHDRSPHDVGKLKFQPGCQQFMIGPFLLGLAWLFRGY